MMVGAMTDIPNVPRDTPPPDDAPDRPEHRFPCSTCGAQMQFAPGGDHLICPNCGNTEPIDTRTGRAAATRELDFVRHLRDAADAADIEETRTVTCPNCGATTELLGADEAGRCPFCDTPVVVDAGTDRHIRPAAVLPFAIDEGAARAAMTDWLGALWFAPNGLQDYARKGRRMNGVYVPYWTYDAATASRYTGQRGTHYYVTRTVTRNGKRQQVRERRTRWRAVSGRVARAFDDVLVLASRSLPKSYTDALEPWDLGALEPYRPEFLAGFRAETYRVGLEDGFAEARDIMDGIIRGDVRHDIGGDEQRIGAVDTDVSDVTFKHVLLPVWLAAYKYRGRTFRFVVNARTGEVQGERPWSRWKIAFAVLLALIAAGIAAYVYSLTA